MANSKKEEQKKITLDDLARLVQDGFMENAQRFAQVASKADLELLHSDMNILRNDMNAQFVDLKHDLKPLKEHDNEYGADISEIRGRLNVVDKKLGIRKK